jgi:uncharacterized protein
MGRARPTVVVFARVPMRGATKTRLAAAIGDAAARRFHLDMIARTMQALADPRWRLALSVTPDRFARRGRLWPQGVARVAQGTGDLGQRMARALSAARPDAPACVVGTDIPDLRAEHITRSLAQLATHDVVFGPATDGGYWLVALRDGMLARDLFRDVRWSSPHALADTLANLPAARRAAFIETLDDVDDAAAYARWRASHP